MAQLRDHVAMKCDSCAESCHGKSGEVQQDMVASLSALKEIMAEERASREENLQSLREEFGQKSFASDAQLKKLVTDLCAKEREQAKSLLAHAKQILESDEVLRQRLQSVLQCEMVSKEEFLEEIRSLRQAMRTDVADPAARFQALQQGEAPLRSARGRPPSTASVARLESRGSSPLPPSRTPGVQLAPTWQAATAPVMGGASTPLLAAPQVAGLGGSSWQAGRSETPKPGQVFHSPHGVPAPISRAPLQSPRPPAP